MRVISILVGTLVLVGALHTRRAEACGQADGDIGSLMVVAGVYLGGTAAFGIKDIVTSDPSVNYGWGETLFNAPIAIAWGKYLIDEAHDPYRSSDSMKTAGVFLGIHAALLAHGIYTIAKPRPRKQDTSPATPRPYQGPPGMYQVGPVSAAITPAPMHDGAGIGLSGTF